MKKDIVDPKLNGLAREIVDAAFKVHFKLGPGLLEQIYETCFAKELAKKGLRFKRQVDVPVVYDGENLGIGFRLDILVEDLVIVELKAIEAIQPVHEAQLLSYLRLSEKKLGFLINFNVPAIKRGIKRMAL
jgi:GxxExxY protein